jgi:nucleoside phosphorylase
MLTILVVEDDADKLRRILSALAVVEGYNVKETEIARDTNEAKRLLRTGRYDLLILDIALPERADGLPKPLAGIDLLEELIARDIYQKPREIVGLTAFTEVREQASRRFAEDLWLVIQYDPASDIWADQLRRKIQHISMAKRSVAPPDYGSYLAVVTALASPELSAVLDIPWNWQVFQQANDGTVYYRGFVSKSETSYEVIAAAAPRMGMTASAILSMKLVAGFRPKYLAIAGITAGLRGRCSVGDILVADPGWDWGSGKHFLKKKSPHFAPAPHQINLDYFIRGKLAWMAQTPQVFDEIRQGWRGPKPNSILQMHIGPVASGSAVLANPKLLDGIEHQHRKVLGIEMETYGAYAAAQECPLPQPKAFSLKSVCDFADAEKNDDFQEFAAYTSASALRIFVERYL